VKVPSLVVAATFFGMSLGYLVGKKGDAGGSGTERIVLSSKKPSNRTDFSARRADPGADAMLENGRDLAGLLASEAFELLKAVLPDNSNLAPLELARRNYQFQQILRKIPTKILAQVMDLAVEGGTITECSRAIFSAYVVRDGAKAMEWASAQPRATWWSENAVDAMVADDPTLAMEMFQRSLRDGSPTENRGATWAASWKLAEEYAKQGVGAFFSFLDAMPSSGVSNLVSGAINDLPKEDIPRFLTEVAKRIKEGKVDEYAMSNILQATALTDPDLAWSWIEKTEDAWERAERSVAFARIINQKGNASEAAEIVKEAMALQPGKEKDFFMSLVTSSSYDGNIEFALRMQSLLPEGMEMTKDDVLRLRGRSTALDWVGIAKFLPAPEERAAYLVDAIKDLREFGKPNTTDFEVLTARLEAIELTEDGQARQRELAVR
jgi:hypothetical protein